MSTPATVISDRDGILAVRLDPGSSFTFPEHPFGPPPWSRQEQWGATIVLQLMRAGDAYAVWKFFEVDGIRIWKDVEDLHHQRVEGRIDLDTVGPVLAAAAEVSALLDSDRRWWQPWDDWTP